MYNEFFENKQGILTIGDVHGYYRDFLLYYNYAKNNNLLFIPLGDYVDNGPDSMLVLARLLEGYEHKFCLPIVGNHDEKYYRYLLGNKVKVGKAMQPTIDSSNTYPHIPKLFTQRFKDFFCWINTKFGNRDYCFVHGSYVPSMKKFQTMGGLRKKDPRVNKALRGETDETNNEKGYPTRLYNWVQDIPNNMSVFVGHDIRNNYPVVEENFRGGKVYFMDTGKKQGGPLFSALIEKNGIVHFIKL